MDSPALLVGLFIVTVIVIIVLSAVHHYKQLRAYEEWAARRGFRLDKGRYHGMAEAYPTLTDLRRGSDRYAYDLVTGEWRGRPVRVFHYHYETYSRDSKGKRRTSHHHLTVVSVTSEIPLQHLDIRPEGIFDKVASFFGVEDINFESAEFSRRFHVSATNRKWAYDILHSRSIEYLLQRPTGPISLYGNYAATWFSDTYSPREVETGLETISGLLDLIPEYVQRQQREGGAPAPVRLRDTSEIMEE